MIRAMARNSALTLETALDRLARAHPRDFVRIRESLAKELQDGGAASAAASLRKRKRPPVSVWAVNRLALDSRADIDGLVDAMGKVRAAQLGRSGGKEDSPVARGRQSQRELTQRLMRRAQDALKEAGVNPTRDLLRRIETTLLAAASDRESQSTLREGRLERELAPLGFDVFGGATPAPRQLPKHRARGEPASDAPSTSVREPADRARLRVVPTSREERDESGRERQALARAERLAAAKQQRAELRERLEALRQAAREASAAVKQAKTEAAEAARRVREAESKATEAQRAVAAAAKSTRGSRRGVSELLRSRT